MLEKQVSTPAGVKKVTLSAEDEAAVRAEWAANDIAVLAQKLASVKEEHKDKLRKDKIDQLITAQLTAVDNAADEASVLAVSLP